MISKTFKQQDYFRYKKLGIKWRKPRGRQSKLRIQKGGSGLRPSIGYGTAKSEKNLVRRLHVVNVNNPAQLQNLTGEHGVLISGSVGMKNTLGIYKAAKEKGLKILNMKKVRRALKKEKEIRKRQEEKLAKPKEASADKKEATKEGKKEKKEEK